MSAPSLTDVLRTAPRGAQGPRTISQVAARTADETRTYDHMDVLGRCKAAARMETDRDSAEDCALSLYADLLAEARSHGTDGIRRDRARLAYLRLEARSWERARKLRADREEATSELPSLETAELAGNPADSVADALALSPRAARTGAAQLCDMLGLRTGGKIETAFYVWLRGDDIAQADIAEELGMTHGAVRNAISQAGALIGAVYASPTDLLGALGMIADRELDTRRDDGASMRLRTYRRDSWRTRPEAAADVRTGHAVPTRLPMSDDYRAVIVRRAKLEARRDPNRFRADQPITGWRVPKNMRGKAGMAHLTGKPLPHARLTGGDRR